MRRLLWKSQLKRIRAWCVRLFFAATIGFAVPVRQMRDIKSVGRGALMAVVCGLAPKLLSGLPGMEVRHPLPPKRRRVHAHHHAWPHTA